MQIKKYKLPNYMIKEWDTTNLDFDKKLTEQRIKNINSLTRKFRNLEIHLDRVDSIYIAVSEIKINQDLQHFQAILLLIEFALEIDFYHSKDLIHGDIKYSNIIITNNQITLIDWEPILEFSISNINYFRSSMPYISSKDIINRKISKSTDRIAFFFLCKRILQSWQKIHREQVLQIENKIIDLSCFEIIHRFFILSDLYKNNSFIK